MSSDGLESLNESSQRDSKTDMGSGKGDGEAGTTTEAGVSRGGDQHGKAHPQVTRHINALVGSVGAREEHAERGDGDQ